MSREKEKEYTKVIKITVNRMIVGVYLFVFAFALFGCTANTPVPSSEQTRPTQDENTNLVKGAIDAKTMGGNDVRGNTAGNIINGGLVAVQGDWIYYSSPEDIHNYNMGLYKARTDDSGRQMLTDGNVAYINVVGDWIYYTKDLLLYKIRTDGTEEQVITSADSGGYPLDSVFNVNVIGGWIYYLFNEPTVLDGHIYKIRTNGAEEQLLSGENDSVSSFSIDGDWIYYRCHADNGVGQTTNYFYKMRTDGTEKQRLLDNVPSVLTVADGWIYGNYNNHNDMGYCLYKISGDGLVDQALLENTGNFSTTNAAGDWVYYSDSDVGLWKIRADGSEKKNMLEALARTSEGYYRVYDNISIVGDWVFYTSTANGLNTLYKIRADGSESQRYRPVN
ncbi:hypothetical protein AGMMS49975_14380 [Clostridia bacterium]|nr:hypothetical protein AGMMS49975_14380 [Clostridia bacterium]